MSQTIKNLVLLFLADLPKSKYEQFNKALELYKQLPNKEEFQVIKLNRVGFSDSNLAFLLYDLQKLCSISDLEIKTEKSNKVVQLKPELKTIPQFILDMNEEELKAWANDYQVENRVADAKEIIDSCFDNEKSIAKDIAISLTEELEKIENSEEYLEYLKTLQVEKEEVVIPIIKGTLPEDNKKLREDYPFLNEKDCPEILFVVVGKKVAAYKRYQANHAKLQQILDKTLEASKEEEDALAIIVEEDFNENLLLHKELEHYKETGKILGTHSIFAETVIRREVEEMTKGEQVNFINSSIKYFHDQNKKLVKAGEDQAKIESINRLVKNREFKLSLVKEKLGVSE